MGAVEDPRHALGRRAEEAAARYLLDAGYSIVARNVRVGRLEVDLLVRHGGTIAVVEVRARAPGAWVRALDTIDWRKRARLRRAGEALWRQRFKHDPTAERMRFDVVGVTFGEGDALQVEHVPAAF